MKRIALLLGLSLAAVPTVRAQGPLQPPPVPPENPVTQPKADLGKALFWDEQLSSTRTTACGTCHINSAGGSDPRSVPGSPAATNPGRDRLIGTPDDIIGSPGVPLSLADGTYDLAAFFGVRTQVTRRKAPPAINAGYGPRQFWDARATGELRDPITDAVVIATGASLETQALAPPVGSSEMGHLGRDWSDVAARVAGSTPLALSPQVPVALANWINGRSYPELFEEAFGTPEVTPVRIAMAIATYERTLFSDQTPWDAAIGGGPPLTPQEQQGQNLMVIGNCTGCHSGNRFTDEAVHYIGVRPQSEDLGRFAITGNPLHRGAMKTPGLRNVELRAPYMHNGRFNTLEEVVAFYNRGGDFDAPNKSLLIQPLGFSQQAQNALVAFLKRPLTDPRVRDETGPFERPLLYSESSRVPVLHGAGTAGSGGFVPAMLAQEPPQVGNPSMTLAVDNALGGAQAWLLLDPSVRLGGRLFRGTTLYMNLGNKLQVLPAGNLNGLGSGEGWSSLSVSVPNRAGLVGVQVASQWLVRDMGGPAGWASSEAALLDLF